MVLTPILIEKMPIPAVQLIYGGIAALSAVLFVILARENPRTPPCPPGMEARSLMLDGLKHALTVRFLWHYLLVSAFTLGFFLVSTSPIGMQYAAEVTYPTPEGTSNGLIQLFGQASVIFV